MKAHKSVFFSSFFFLLFLQANASLDRRQSLPVPPPAATASASVPTTTPSPTPTPTPSPTLTGTGTSSSASVDKPADPTSDPTPPSTSLPTSTLTTPSPISTPTASPPITTPPTSPSVVVITASDGVFITSTVTNTLTSDTATSASASSSASGTPSDDEEGGMSTGSIVGLSVAGGVALIGIIGFFVWKFTRKRFADFDDNEAIKWPDLNTHGAGGNDSHPLPVKNTGRSGFDTGSDGSLSRVPSTNYSTPDFASGSADPYAVPPLPHLNPNQPYRDDPGASGAYYDPYHGPIPGTIEHGAPGGQWGGEVIPMNQLASGRMSPGPHTAYGGADPHSAYGVADPAYEYDIGNGRQSPGPHAAYARTPSPGPQAAYGGRMSPGPQTAYAGAMHPQSGPPHSGDYHDGYSGR